MLEDCKVLKNLIEIKKIIVNQNIRKKREDVKKK